MKVPRLALAVFLFLVSAVLFSRSAAAAPFPITIDATGLDTTNLAVDSLPRVANGAPIVVNLSAGLHKLCTPAPTNCFDFTVGLAGEIGYGPDVAGFATGQGTSTLTVKGYETTIDPTALTVTHFYVRNGTVGGGSIPKAVKKFKIIPGDYTFCAPTTAHCVTFTLKTDATINFAVSLDSYVSGRGTSTLTLVGFPISVDATSLDATHYYVQQGFVGGGSQPNAVTNYRVLPGSYSFCAPSSYQCITFTVKTDGKIDYAAALDPFVSGRSTTKLTVIGYTIIIDADLLAAKYFQIEQGSIGVGGGGGSQPNVVTPYNVIPGVYSFCAPTQANCFSFTVTMSGVVQYDEIQNFCVSGYGTDTLTVGCICTLIRRGVSGQVVDAQLSQDQPSANFGAATTMNTGVHDPGGRYQSLVRFDLSSLPPNQGIASAKMILQLTAAPTDPLSIETHEVANAWSENAVTWSSFYASPVAINNLGGLTIQGTTATRDLTTLVRAWVAGTKPNQGVRLTHPTYAASWLTSEAADVSARPALLVCYDVPE